MPEIGEKKTGWMIIASLPLEEQRGEKLQEAICNVTNIIGYGNVFGQIKIKDIFEALSLMFEYTGDKNNPWTEVKE